MARGGPPRPESLGIPPFVRGGSLRLVTHLRIVKQPSPLGDALEFLDLLQRSSSPAPVEPGDRHWEIFTKLGGRIEAKGNQFPTPSWQHWRSSGVRHE